MIEVKTWFTSDLHFGHDRDFLYGPRGFKNTTEMSEEIVKRWNAVVSKEDTVYVLGDLMLNDDKYGMSLLKQLNGTLVIIRGNHDSDKRISNYVSAHNVAYVTDASYLKYKGWNFYLSHYPTITDNMDNKPLHRKLINLFGHTHQKEYWYEDYDNMFHVGMDSNDCRPIEIDEIIEKLKEHSKR